MLSFFVTDAPAPSQTLPTPASQATTSTTSTTSGTTEQNPRGVLVEINANPPKKLNIRRSVHGQLGYMQTKGDSSVTFTEFACASFAFVHTLSKLKCVCCKVKSSYKRHDEMRVYIACINV